MSNDREKGKSERPKGSESDQTRRILETSPDLKDAKDMLADYLVGFILIHENDARFLGSGTLVGIGDTKAILTAGHVLEALPETGRVGLALPTRFDVAVGAESLQMEYVTRVCLGRGENKSDGPDLGLLILPDPVASRIIPSTKMFYNLLKRREAALESRAAIDQDGIGQPDSDGDAAETWVLVGTPAESQADGPPEAGFDRVKEIEGQMGLGAVVSSQRVEGFDYLDFSAKYEENYEGPESFEGYSGGSLWHLSGVLNGNEFLLKNLILKGVPFWQSAKTCSERIIKCHGPKSIYELLIDKVMKCQSRRSVTA